MNSYLEEYGEHDDRQRGGDEHLLWRDDLLLDHFDQTEPYRPPEPPVGHDELLLQVNLADAAAVRKEHEAVHA